MNRDCWTLYLSLDYQALPWPWPGRTAAELTPEQGATLPHLIWDFLAYSPTDGSIDQVHVAPELPRQTPICQTGLGVYHEAGALHICVLLLPPSEPIAELAGNNREDICCVLPEAGGLHGIYLGMDERGRSTARREVWDRDALPPGIEPACGEIKAGFRAGVCELSDARLAWFRLAQDLVGNPFAMSVGRHCHATGELVSWGAPIVWRPTPGGHGQVQLVEEAKHPAGPVLQRVDLVQDRLRLRWRGMETLGHYRRGQYADYVDKMSVAVNGQEATQPLAAELEAAVQLNDGWNRIEILTAFAPPRIYSLQVFPSDRLCPNLLAAEGPAVPSRQELATAFAGWQVKLETRRQAPGAWGPADKARYCLCHDGVFVAEAYLDAVQYLDNRPVYRERIRETAERMLAAQHADGWYPCYCSATQRDGKPEKGDGGAFTQGSVGEFCARAGILLDEPRYWESAVRGADYAWYPAEINQNYAAFTAWHLCALYRHEQRPEWLERAVYYLRHFGTRDIGPSGAQGGHNFFTGYGDITLRGMANLLQVLPPTHDFYPDLRARTFRFTNQLLSRRQAAGNFAARNRKYLGYNHYCAGLFSVAEALPELRAELSPVLLGMVASGDGPLLGRTAKFLGYSACDDRGCKRGVVIMRRPFRG